MTATQIELFTLLGFVFVFLIWGRWRYDLVAFTALVIALMLGIVPKEEAFSGFGHPATAIIALVLIVSKGLSNSGAIELLSRQITKFGTTLAGHITAMSTIAAALSAVMNNVAALALLMPVDIEAARKAGRSPALTLMPLSFASILGGMITMIGTPPNIIIAEFRKDAVGESFGMFDFAPVGIITAIAGVLFVASIGWRLIPKSAVSQDPGKALENISPYLTELHVGDDSPLIGRRVRDIDEEMESHDAVILGLTRANKRKPGRARIEIIQLHDTLIIEAVPETLDSLTGSLGLTFRNKDKTPGLLDNEDMQILEVVVPPGARIEDRTALSFRLQQRQSVTLLGISRQGKPVRERVRATQIKAGDILLLFGDIERLREVSRWLGTLALDNGATVPRQRHKAFLAIGLFATAIAVASFGWVYLPIALAAVTVSFVFLQIVPIREVYTSIEWPVIVLLGSMIPIGAALESSGGTQLIASSITSLGEGMPPSVILLLLMVITMTLSDVMNNTATAVIAAPIAIEIASQLNANPDPFLMTVAVAASCAFLTPIGHKNNTLIMGPGGYRFGDYWRMGLPLEILVITVSIPVILWVWPLGIN